MKSHLHLIGTGTLAAVLALGLSACGEDRRAATGDMDTTADRVTPREHDTQQSAGAPGGTFGSADRVESPVTEMERQWAIESAQSGMAEVQLGELAKKKASSDKVKEFGSSMVEDHTSANDRLKAIASQNGINLPAELDAKHKQTMNRLEQLSAAQFDRAYMQEMVKAHKNDVEHFQEGSNQLEHPQLKEFASSTLPTLQEHLTRAQSISGDKHISRNK
jgi:putative membrane protein